MVMLQHVLAALVIAALFATFIFLPIWMVRDIVQCRRERRSGSSMSSGIVGMMTEIDRVVRPSVQHVMDAEELADTEDDDIGGE
jgi:hypothetical protein